MATASSGQHHASLNLMACVRESSPQQEDLVGDALDTVNRHGTCYLRVQGYLLTHSVAQQAWYVLSESSGIFTYSLCGTTHFYNDYLNRNLYKTIHIILIYTSLWIK